MVRSFAIACVSATAALLWAGLGSAPAGAGAGQDPLLAFLLGCGVAALFGTPRPAARWRAALLGAAASGLVVACFGPSLPAVVLAALLGAGVAWISPLQGSPPRRGWEGRRGASAGARF